jgi:hypothetical protein
MGKLYLRLSAFICVLFLLASSALAQGGVSVTAEVDRTTIATDDLLTLTVTVAGDYQQLGEPQLPLIGGFNVVGSSRSSQFSMVNGVVTARTVFTYGLQPTGPGTFTIEPITILVNSAPYQTDPITVQVTQGAAPTPMAPEPAPGQGPAAPAPGGLVGQDLYVEADVDDPTPVVGQQIIYCFRFYQAVNLFNQPQLAWPTFSGFWTENLSPNNVYEQAAGGRRYRVTEVRRALFPTAGGQVTIEPARLTIPGDLLSGDIVLQTEPVAVDVQPLPAGAPAGFAGVVGQLEIEAWVEPGEARVNEPVTLFVRVSGKGNLSTLPDPTEGIDLLLPDWRVYDPQTTTDVGQDGDAIRGEKRIERLLVPKVEGALSIPSFLLAYFDPQAGAYRQVETGPLLVQVAPGESTAPGPLLPGGDKQEITLLASDIRHIKAAPPALATGRTPLLGQLLYWLGWVVPPLAAVGAWTWERRRRRLSSDVAYARAQRARHLARQRLAQARKQARLDQDAAYAAVARALTDYLGDKFNLPAAGLTRDAIAFRLSPLASRPLVDRVLACLDWADSGRFAPAAAGRDAGELVATTETLITELEKALQHET